MTIGHDYSKASFQIAACDNNNGLIGTDGYSVFMNAYNVQNLPISWSINSFSGDIENVTIDPNSGEVLYDVVDTFSNGGRGDIVVTATDSLNCSVTTQVCVITRDPVQVDQLACNGDLVANSPATQQKAIFHGLPESARLFTDLAKTTNPNDGDDILVWETASGSGDAIVQNNAPQYVENVVNSQAVLRFDDGNTESIQYDVPAPPAPGSPFKLFFLVAPQGNQSNATIVASTEQANNNSLNANTWQISRFGAGNNFGFRIDGGGWTNINAGFISSGSDLAADNVSWTDITDGDFHLIYVDYDGTTVSMFIDGTLEAQADPAQLPLAEHIKFYENRAGGNFLSGDLAEFVFADATMTDVEAVQVQAYFLCKYGLDASLIADPGPFAVEDNFYDTVSQFELQTYSDNSQQVFDLINGIYYPVGDVPTPGLGLLQTNASVALSSGIQLQNVIGAATPAYADDADAGVNGLTVGNIYQTDGTGAAPLNVAGIVMIKQ